MDPATLGLLLRIEETKAHLKARHTDLQAQIAVRCERQEQLKAELDKERELSNAEALERTCLSQLDCSLRLSKDELAALASKAKDAGTKVRSTRHSVEQWQETLASTQQQLVDDEKLCGNFKTTANQATSAAQEFIERAAEHESKVRDVEAAAKAREEQLLEALVSIQTNNTALNQQLEDRRRELAGSRQKSEAQIASVQAEANILLEQTAAVSEDTQQLEAKRHTRALSLKQLQERTERARQILEATRQPCQQL